MPKTEARPRDAVEDLFPADDEAVQEMNLDELAEKAAIDKTAIRERVSTTSEETWAQVLDAPLDMTAVKTRKGAGGADLSYLEWHYITRQLNRIFGYGHWSTDIKEVQMLGQQGADAPRGVLVRMTLMVEFRGIYEYEDAKYNKTTTFENTGYAPNSKGSWEMLEMAVGAATQTAFKRCATALGDQFGLCLYEKEKTEETGATAPVNPSRASSGPSSSPAGGTPLQYLGQSSFECQDCGREVQGYASAKTGKSYTTQDLWDMSIKQTGGLYCFNCKLKHAKR